MKKITQYGFTLVEMVTVLAIFMVMTSIVLFNYNKFTSETILTNMAYEVALSIREAQIYGVSVRNPNGTVGTAAFGKPYGVYFPSVAGGTSSYYLFSDSQTANGFYDGGAICTAGSGECVTPYTLQRNVKITNLRVMRGSGCEYPTNGGSISVLFKRPNPEPIFNNDNNALQFAEITLTAPDGAVRYVVVRNNGQIFVDNTSSCFSEA
jgi:prepilin-type N-terminal cleavage/methylation domain-containing protein